MRGLCKPPNAERSRHPTETEEQITKGGVQGDSTRKRKGRRNTGRRGGCLLVTQRRQAAALLKNSVAAIPIPKNTTLSQSLEGHVEATIPKDEGLTRIGSWETKRERERG